MRSIWGMIFAINWIVQVSTLQLLTVRLRTFWSNSMYVSGRTTERTAGRTTERTAERTAYVRCVEFWILKNWRCLDEFMTLSFVLGWTVDRQHRWALSYFLPTFCAPARMLKMKNICTSFRRKSSLEGHASIVESNVLYLWFVLFAPLLYLGTDEIPILQVVYRYSFSSCPIACFSFCNLQPYFPYVLYIPSATSTSL